MNLSRKTIELAIAVLKGFRRGIKVTGEVMDRVADVEASRWREVTQAIAELEAALKEMGKNDEVGIITNADKGKPFVYIEGDEK